MKGKSSIGSEALEGTERNVEVNTFLPLCGIYVESTTNYLRNASCYYAFVFRCVFEVCCLRL